MFRIYKTKLFDINNIFNYFNTAFILIRFLSTWIRYSGLLLNSREFKISSKWQPQQDFKYYKDENIKSNSRFILSTKLTKKTNKKEII